MASSPKLLGAFFFGLLLFPGPSEGQESGVDLGTPEIAFAAEPKVIFNFNDAYAGLNLGIMDHQNLWALTTFFNARLFTRRTLIKRPEAYYQYKEWRGMFGFQLDKFFFFSSDVGFYLEGMGAYTFGTFRATTTKPTPAWFLYPGAGLAVPAGDGSVVKFGAQWTPIPGRDEIAPFRVKFSGVISSSE